MRRTCKFAASSDTRFSEKMYDNGIRRSARFKSRKVTSICRVRIDGISIISQITKSHELTSTVQAIIVDIAADEGESNVLYRIDPRWKHAEDYNYTSDMLL